MPSAAGPKPDQLRPPSPQAAVRWTVLSALSCALSLVLWYASIPASILLGAMGAGIAVAVLGWRVGIPRQVLLYAQGLIGCMIARSISLEIVHDILERWPLFLLMVVSVSLVATSLGWLLARTGILPGSTAIWGTSPGAALIMTLMSDEFGADSRLVAFMQYFRVLMVTLVATLLSRFWGEPKTVGDIAGQMLGGFNWAGFGETILLACSAVLVGVYLRLPASPILFPLVVGSILNISGIITIELPWWLLAAAYTVVGWSVGIRFTRPIVLHAVRALPYITATFIVMIALCGGLALVLGHYAGIDPITAYLATSPGGMDAIAIIAASSGGNMSLVMAVQTTRFILVSATSPTLATYVASKTGFTESGTRS